MCVPAAKHIGVDVTFAAPVAIGPTKATEIVALDEVGASPE
jgi:hypothetical protein